MNTYFAVAAGLAFLTGVIHSVIGELLVFRRLRRIAPYTGKGSDGLPIAHLRILWASWHLVAVFGWGFGVILIQLSMSPSQFADQAFVESVIIFSMSGASLIVLLGTRENILDG